MSNPIWHAEIGAFAIGVSEIKGQDAPMRYAKIAVKGYTHVIVDKPEELRGIARALDLAADTLEETRATPVHLYKGPGVYCGAQGAAVANTRDPKRATCQACAVAALLGEEPQP